jgi:phosphatidylglycerophosphate synthase
MEKKRPATTIATTPHSALACGYIPDVRWMQWVVAVPLLGVGAMLVAGDDSTLLGRYLIGCVLGSVAQAIFLAAMVHRIGREQNTLADLLTLGRMTAGTLLLALVAAGLHDRTGQTGIMALLVMLIAASALDWLDGPLARRLRATRLGAVLDIEADSWLTLWASAAAVAWGGLPWLCLLPPIVRYAHPLRSLRAGGLPRGGGPGWSRVTGVAQMILFALALLPLQGQFRDLALTLIAYPISLAQLATMIVLLRQRN